MRTVVAQTVPSKTERVRLEIDVADMAGCDRDVARAVISRVLAAYEVTEAGKPRHKRRVAE